jgi:hypothetical protein
MNRKQLEEFAINKNKKKAEDTAFALEANKGAEEKERLERVSHLQKQKEYAVALKLEMEQKNRVKIELRQRAKVDVQKEIE